MDKRLLYIVVGLLVIGYVLGQKTHPELMLEMRSKAVAMWNKKSFSPGDDSGSSTDEWEKHRQNVFFSRVSDSKRRAIAKYPALETADSEMNIRFVYRYKCMVKDNNPRLKTPDWPELLADDCAATMHLKPRVSAPAPDAPAHPGAPANDSVATR